jgi:hypothetical protein
MQSLSNLKLLLLLTNKNLKKPLLHRLMKKLIEKHRAEVKAFMKWANKGKRARLFEFKSLDPIVGDALNRCAFDGDLDTARALAKAYLT